jgi:hypothetical protein
LLLKGEQRSWHPGVAEAAALGKSKAGTLRKKKLGVDKLW